MAQWPVEFCTLGLDIDVPGLFKRHFALYHRQIRVVILNKSDLPQSGER